MSRTESMQRRTEVLERGWIALRLPRALSVAEGGRLGGTMALAPLRVLVVEDEGLLALEIETYLERGGYRMAGTADALAPALILAGAERPDLALVDIRLLHDDSGLELAADLGALGVPVLFVTGNCPAQAGAPLALGCLHKPFDEWQLLAAVAIAGRLIRGEPVDPATLPSGLHLYGP